MHGSRATGEERRAALGRAGPLLDAVQADPRDAADRARALSVDGTASLLERIGALWALGRALSELDAVEGACRTLTEAVALAEDAAEPALGAEIRVSLSVCLLTGGDPESASAQLDEAEAAIPEGGPRGRLVMQRGLLHIYAGRLAAALDELDRALPLLVEAGDDVARCRLLSNRGVVLAFTGQLDRAEQDLTTCRDLAANLGQDMAAAAARHNLGFVRGRRGDVPGALEAFDQARRTYVELGAARLVANLDSDMCSVLLAGGLAAEAAVAADRAASAAEAAGNRLTAAEARLLQAEALLSAGDARDAMAIATRAAEAFRAADRGPWAVIAEHAALRADLADGGSDEPDLDDILRIADDLDAHGWTVEASVARTLAGRLASEQGRTDLARRALARSVGGRRRGPAVVRANAWLATAMLRLAEGDRAGARRALAAGLRVLAAHQASLGATEMRVHVASQAAELARAGLRMAVEDGDAVGLLRWAERWRAGALSLPPVRPPRDGHLARLLTDLRSLEGTERETLLAGGEVDDGPVRRAELEEEIRRLSRRTAGSRSPALRLDVRAVQRQVGEAGVQLVELVDVDDELHGVVVDADGVRLRGLGSSTGVRDEVALALAAVRRLAVARSSARSLDAARRSLEALGRSLDERLLGPLGLGEHRPVVVVPTGALQRLPWSILPSLEARPVVVAPSAALWMRATTIRRIDGPVVLVGGPDLAHVARELRALAEVHPDAVVLASSEARADAVLDAMSGARLVHLAAHGTLRADSPLFSSLRLSDGSLTVYDIEHLPDAPATVVLPACDAGASAVARGDELIGAAAGLLSVGVAQVVAPLTLVPDDATADLVVDLHRAIVGGSDVASALASARVAALSRGRPQDVAAAHSFTLLGGS